MVLKHRMAPVCESPTTMPGRKTETGSVAIASRTSISPSYFVCS